LIWKIFHKSPFFWIGSALLGLIFVVFHVHNFPLYHPLSGYDSPAHIAIAEYVRWNWEMPPVDFGYGASNPPLYYYVAAVILTLTGSLKALQFFSFLCYLVMSGCFILLLQKWVTHRLLLLSVLALFLFWPLSLGSAYIIYNYSLGYCLGILALTLTLSMLISGRLTLKQVFALSATLAFGLLTSLTNFAMIPVCFGGILANRAWAWRKRWQAVGLGAMLMMALLLPGLTYQVDRVGCVFCTKHRLDVTRLPGAPVFPFPLKYYYHFPLRAVATPYSPKYLRAGLNLLLHQTLYSDYFNYLVGPTLRGLREDRCFPRGPEMPCTRPHYLDRQKIENMVWLNVLGFAITPFLIYALLSGARQTYRQLRRLEKSKISKTGGLIDMFLLGAFAMPALQFLYYIHRYPEYLNVHAGYLYTSLFALLLLLARRIQATPRSKYWIPLLGSACLIYTGMCLVTFWLR